MYNLQKIDPENVVMSTTLGFEQFCDHGKEFLLMRGKGKATIDGEVIIKFDFVEKYVDFEKAHVTLENIEPIVEVTGVDFAISTFEEYVNKVSILHNLTVARIDYEDGRSCLGNKFEKSLGWITQKLSKN